MLFSSKKKGAYKFNVHKRCILITGVGFMEAPIITYVGEISEPRFRGMLTSYAGIFVSLGFVFIYAMGNFFDWQHVAAISCTIPIITIIAISQVSFDLIFYNIVSNNRFKERNIFSHQ